MCKLVLYIQDSREILFGRRCLPYIYLLDKKYLPFSYSLHYHFGTYSKYARGKTRGSSNIVTIITQVNNYAQYTLPCIILWKTYTQPSSFVTKDDINSFYNHYSDVVMGAIAFQITIITIAYSTVYTGTKKTSTLRVTAFVMGIYGWPVTSPHKGQ